MRVPLRCGSQNLLQGQPRGGQEVPFRLLPDVSKARHLPLQRCRALLAGIGELYQRLDWDHYEGDPEVVKTLQDYVRGHEDYIDQGLGLLFTGKRGIGKTMLATLVLKELIRAATRAISRHTRWPWRCTALDGVAAMRSGGLRRSS